MNNKKKSDVCIIGAGAAGLSVAAGLAQLGLSTVLCEKGKMGGDCLNTGCVPSKALLYAGKTAQAFRKPSVSGIEGVEPVIDFGTVKDHVSQVIASIEKKDSKERFESLGVRVVIGAAAFVSPDAVQVAGETISARHFIIATGSRAAVPPIPGLARDKILTNENIFLLREKPEHLVIIGGGPIGIEMAQAHRRLGSKVTVLDIAVILPKDDPEMVAVLREHLKEEGVEILEKASIEKIEHGESHVSVWCAYDGKSLEIKGSHLLVAAGRQVNVEGLGLEKAGVEFDRRGIKTDGRLRSSNKRIYAVGDVAGGPQFTHVAAYHAGIVIRNIAFRLPAKVDYTALPWATYADPELANVGMTQDMAVRQFGKNAVRTVSLPFTENDRAQTERKTGGMIKAVALANGRILGASIVGENAGDMLGIWCLAIRKKMKLSDIAGIIAPYPTRGEISKRVSGVWYAPQLFSEKTKKLVHLLKIWPF
ncbi:MAG: FAD-binding protein [Alphaproteobacteria bacterium]|nr:FAD-binding protein [Alphaproteobacteria bacterium]